jgi:hypothetical protein
MIKVLAVVLLAGLLAGSVSGASIQYEVSTIGDWLGEPMYRFNYSFTGGPLNAGTEIDIRFPQSMYKTIWNGQAGWEFDVLLLQPNNPPGAVGVLSLLAFFDTGAVIDPFSVDFLLAPGGSFGPQDFYINEYDPWTLEFLGTVESGVTTAVSTEPPSHVPEPSALVLAGLGLAIVGVLRKRAQA